MKLLLDENLPHELRNLLPGHEVFTTNYMKWSGITNGDLLARAGASGFDALITLDSGIEFEQNLASLPCTVIILTAKSNKVEDLRPLLPTLRGTLKSLNPNSLIKLK